MWSMGRSLGYTLSVTKTTPPQTWTKLTSKTPNGLRRGHRERDTGRGKIQVLKRLRKETGGSVICNIIEIKFSEISWSLYTLCIEWTLSPRGTFTRFSLCTKKNSLKSLKLYYFHTLFTNILDHFCTTIIV